MVWLIEIPLVVIIIIVLGFLGLLDLILSNILFILLGLVLCAVTFICLAKWPIAKILSTIMVAVCLVGGLFLSRDIEKIELLWKFRSLLRLA